MRPQSVWASGRISSLVLFTTVNHCVHVVKTLDRRLLVESGYGRHQRKVNFQLLLLRRVGFGKIDIQFQQYFPSDVLFALCVITNILPSFVA